MILSNFAWFFKSCITQELINLIFDNDPIAHCLIDLCSKRLESTNCCEHEKKLFCRQCYGRKYGPKGVGFGGGAGALSMDVGEHLGNKDCSMS